MKTAKGIPVIYYHRVNEVDSPSFAVTPLIFEKQMEALASAGWKTIRLDDLREFVAGRVKLPKHSLTITFDDGYLDNWVYAHPILKRFGLNAVVFVITDRITHGAARPKSDDVEGEALPEIMDNRAANLTYLYNEDAKRRAFLTWDELKAMENSGVWEVASHTHSHGMHYISDTVEGVISSAEPHWTRGLPTEGDMRPGMPFFRGASDMMGLRYFDDLRLRDEMVNHLSDLGGLGYFKERKSERKRELVEAAQKLVKTKYPGKWETPVERSKRLHDELFRSHDILRSELGHPVYDICWPWGECDDESIKVAREIGFKSAFTVRRRPNRAGDDLMRLGRIKITDLNPRKFLSTINLYSKPFIGSVMGKLSGTGRDK